MFYVVNIFLYLIDMYTSFKYILVFVMTINGLNIILKQFLLSVHISAKSDFLTATRN